MKIAIVITMLLANFLTALPASAYSLDSKIGHFYAGVGQNFNLRSNFRIGINSVEFGLVQGGIGMVYVQRTETAVFYQIGALFQDGGGLIGGGGMEWNTFSFFRLRMDVTVKTSTSFQTEGVVCVGGVFIL